MKTLHAYGNCYDSTVEIGHVYAPDTIAPFTEQWRLEDGMELPIFEKPPKYYTEVTKTARNFSVNSLLLTLVDDVGRPEDEAFFTELSVLETLPAEDVYFESAYVEPARALIDYIRRAVSSSHGKYRMSQDGRSVITGSGKEKVKVKLTGYPTIDDPDHPSCQMMDVAWTLDRLQSVAPRTATILPEGYKPQQLQVAAIARIIPEFRDYSVTSIFVNKSGSEVDRYHWSLPNL